MRKSLFTLALVIAVAVPVLAQEAAAPAAAGIAVGEPPPGTDPSDAVKPAAEAAPAAPKREGPEKVTVGAYVNDVQSIDLKNHTYAVDLYIWFRWKDRELKPYESLEFINPSELWGHVRSKSYEEPVELPNGELYQVLRVQGRFSRKLLLTNYPFDRQTLSVEFEDNENETHQMVYVPDENPATVNPKLVLPGFTVGQPRLEVSAEGYPTNFGDIRSRPADVFSRTRIELPIVRPALTYSIKLLLPIFCVLLCAALMFLLKPTYVDSRVGIGTTSMLTIVALQMTLNEDLPDVDYLVLMDKVYIAAYLFVLAGLGVVVRATKMVEAGDVDGGIRLHRRALFGLITSFAVAMVVLVSLAIIRG